MTTSQSAHDWDTFIHVLATTTAQIPDETSSVAWGVPGGPEFVTTRSTDGRYAVVLDATNFPDSTDPYLPPEVGWFIPSDDPAQDSTFALVEQTPLELALAVCTMLTDWAQIQDPSEFLSPGGGKYNTISNEELESALDEDASAEGDADWTFYGRELQSGLELRAQFESLFGQLDVPSYSGVIPGAYALFVAEVAVDLYIDETVPSIQLQAEVRQQLTDPPDGLIMANEANSIATFARFHFEESRLLATWHLSQSYYSPPAMLQQIFGFASAVSTVAAAIPAHAPGIPVAWVEPPFSDEI